MALLNALHAGMNKLSVYYTKTKEIHGSLYAIGTILAPQHKLKFFSSKIWGKPGDDSDRSMHYKESLCEFMKPYAQRLSQTQPLPGDLSHRHTSASSSEIENLFERGPQLPVFSSVARGILSIPATGAGVERLFNSARDICHYQRGQLNSATIQDIMMFRCKSRFEIEVDEFPREDLTPGAAQVVDEQREAQLAAEEPEDISEGEDFSDNEDNNDPVAVIEDEFIMESQHQPSLTGTVSRKRQQSTSIDSEDETSPHLPSQQGQGGTRRRTGLRDARKRSKPDDNQRAYH